MSSEKLRLRAGELYTKEEVCSSLGCGEWLLDVLVSLFGLIRLGAEKTHYEGSDIITALKRHAVNDLVPEEHQVMKPANKRTLEKLKRERTARGN
jgi:hypothetical protein